MSVDTSNIEPVDTMTPAEAANFISKNAEFIRALLRQNKVDWGTAVQGKTGQWNYLIIKSKFLKWIERGELNETKEEHIKETT